MSDSPILQVDRLCVSIGSVRLLNEVSFELHRGEFLAVLGPNGAGKSTLVRSICGERRPTKGKVHLNGTSICRMTPMEQAKIRAVVAQELNLDFPFTAAEVVGMGRFPHRPSNRKLDHAIVEAALENVQLSSFRNRDYRTLSGGEKQRVQLARSLAQMWDCRASRMLILDEATSGLDIAHQHEVLKSTRMFARNEVASCVIAVLHDLNLAAQYADRILMLKGGKVAAYGTPADVLKASTIRSVYGVDSVVMQHPKSTAPLVVPIAE